MEKSRGRGDGAHERGRTGAGRAEMVCCDSDKDLRCGALVAPLGRVRILSQPAQNIATLPRSKGGDPPGGVATLPRPTGADLPRGGARHGTIAPRAYTPPTPTHIINHNPPYGGAARHPGQPAHASPVAVVTDAPPPPLPPPSICRPLGGPPFPAHHGVTLVDP